MLWPQRETAACGLATASPTHSESPLNGLSSRESTIAPLASSNCDSDHIICDWRLTIGITFVALVFGIGFIPARNLGGSRFSEATTLCDCRSYRHRMSNDTSRTPTNFSAAISTNKPRSKNCRSRTVPFSFEWMGNSGPFPRPIKERTALRRVPPRRGPFLPSSSIATKARAEQIHSELSRTNRIGGSLSDLSRVEATTAAVLRRAWPKPKIPAPSRLSRSKWSSTSALPRWALISVKPCSV